MREVAQAALAFLGHPGEAKDLLRAVFEPDEFASTGAVAPQIFGGNIVAGQLLLPALLARRVNQQVKDLKDSQDSPDWLPYGRLHLVWLTGEVLRRRFGISGRILFPEPLSLTLCDSLDSWLPAVFDLARRALSFGVSVANAAREYSGHREFFRSSRHYPRILEGLQNELVGRDLQQLVA